MASGHRAPDTLLPVVKRIFDFDGWTRLLKMDTRDDWETAHAEPAADIVAGWERWTAGDALVHRDMRLDNTTVDAENKSAVLLDWAYASAGAPWIDLAQLAADVVATGGFGRGNGAQIGVSSGPRAECFSVINVRIFGSRPGGVGG